MITDHSAAYTQRTQAEVGRETINFKRVSMVLGDDQDIGVTIAKTQRRIGRCGTVARRHPAVTDVGTEYVQPGKIVLPIMTAPSHHVLHLQPADFVIAPTAVIAGHKAGLDLKRSCWRSSCFPPDYNLYSHAFGETSRSSQDAMLASQCPKRVSPTTPTTPSATVRRAQDHPEPRRRELAGRNTQAAPAGPPHAELSFESRRT
jgi:hypothetical protein